jgi:hypothetical protein
VGVGGGVGVGVGVGWGGAHVRKVEKEGGAGLSSILLPPFLLFLTSSCHLILSEIDWGLS